VQLQGDHLLLTLGVETVHGFLHRMVRIVPVRTKHVARFQVFKSFDIPERVFLVEGLLVDLGVTEVELHRFQIFA
jgi:hypothetical protein